MEPITILATSAIELAKIGAQIYFASARQAGLTEQEIEVLLEEERASFQKNISQPLPDV
jgi:hypothetical protein